MRRKDRRRNKNSSFPRFPGNFASTFKYFFKEEIDIQEIVATNEILRFQKGAIADNDEQISTNTGPLKKKR